MTISLEFGKACEDLSWNHCPSTPHRSETNGIAERAVRKVKEVTSAVLLQSGLDNERWPDSMECFCHVRNIQDKLSDFKHLTKGGSECPLTYQKYCLEQWSNITLFLRKDQSRLHEFGSKVLPGIFFGYALYAGGGVWTGDILVADIEELEQMDASEIYTKRLNAKEVLTPQRSGNFIFMVGDGTVEIFGRGQRLRTSTLTGTIRNEAKNKKFFKEIQMNGFLHLQEDSTRDDEEAKNDFWTITGEFIYRHHVVPRVKLCVPKEESYPIPMKYIDVTRMTHTLLDVLLEKQIEDYWNVDGENELSDAWTGFTRFALLKERPPEGYTWCGWRLSRKQTTSRPDDVWPDVGIYVRYSERRKQNKDGQSRNHNSKTPDN